MIIIRKDTVWGPGTKILTDDIQVAQGAKLIIMPGAQIEGNGHSIESYGNVVAKGTVASPIFLNDLKIGMSDNSSINGRVDISYTHLNGGELGGGSYGSFSLQHSLVTNMTNTIYVWYPQGDRTKIANNVFLDSKGISAGTYDNIGAEQIEIYNNVFDRYYTYGGKYDHGYEGFAVSVWNGGNTIKPILHDNAFLDKSLIAIELKYDGRLQTYNDYFATNRLRDIQKFIYDSNDDLSITNSIDISKSSLSAPAGISQVLRSYSTVTLPSEIVVEARLFGNKNVDVTGNTLNNTLVGNIGNNTLDGGLGADTMSGGAGNDTYIVDNARDVILEYGQKGYDSVVASVSYTLANNVEKLTLSGASAINATGNAAANRLIGNSAANILDGKAGADVMEGGAGKTTPTPSITPPIG